MLPLCSYHLLVTLSASSVQPDNLTSGNAASISGQRVHRDVQIQPDCILCCFHLSSSEGKDRAGKAASGCCSAADGPAKLSSIWSLMTELLMLEALSVEMAASPWTMELRAPCRMVAELSRSPCLRACHMPRQLSNYKQKDIKVHGGLQIAKGRKRDLIKPPSSRLPVKYILLVLTLRHEHMA